MGRKRYFILIFASFLFCGIFLQESFSDTGAFYEKIPNSGNIFPYENQFVQMLNEKVFYSNNHFSIYYIFTNHSSETQNVLCGFPIKGFFTVYDVDDINFGYRNIDKFLTNSKDYYKALITYYKFQFFVNGKPIKYKVKHFKNRDYDYLFIANVSFPPNEIVVISNSYYQEPSYGGDTGAYFVKSSSGISYYLKTGSLWRDKIKRCEIEMYFPADYLIGYKFHACGFEIPILNIHPSNNCKKEVIKTNGLSLLKLKWLFEDFEPDFNIEVGYENELFQGRDEEEFSWDIFYRDYFQDIENFTNFITYIYEDIINADKKELSMFLNDSYAQNPKKLVRFLINSIYALNGYDFDDKEIKALFKKYKWYNPVKKEINLSQLDEKMVKDLRNIENMIPNSNK